MKRVISLVLVLVMLLSFSSGAFAEVCSKYKDSSDCVYVVEPNGANGFYKPSKQEIKDSFKLTEKVMKDYSRNSLQYYDPYYYKVLRITTFEQINGHYCGPAVTKQILHYLNGSSPAMKDIGKSLNTDSQNQTYIGDILEY